MNKWASPIDHLYILCDPVKEPDRAAYLQTWFAKHQVDPSCYTLLSKCYGTTLSTEEAWKHYNPWVNRKPVEQERSFNSYNMKPAEISLCINWAHAAQTAVDAGHKYVMIWESDILFDNRDFLTELHDAMALLKDDWDFLSITAGADLKPRRLHGDTSLKWFRLPPEQYYHTRTCDAMIFRVDMLKKILSTFFPVAEVLDWELNYQLTLHSSRSYWLDPPLLRQGSGSGVYPTTL
jgi:hypothetical protein